MVLNNLSVTFGVPEPDREDFPVDNTTTGRVAVGGCATGEIDGSDDGDFFAVDLVAGRTYVIDLEGVDTGKGTLANPILALWNDAATPADIMFLGGDVDGGIGKNARITFTATETGKLSRAARRCTTAAEESCTTGRMRKN